MGSQKQRDVSPSSQGAREEDHGKEEGGSCVTSEGEGGSCVAKDIIARDGKGSWKIRLSQMLRNFIIDNIEKMVGETDNVDISLGTTNEFQHIHRIMQVGPESSLRLLSVSLNVNVNSRYELAR